MKDRATSSISDVIRARQLRMLFQPIVELDTGVVVGHEALVRGPAGSDLENPLSLFEAAGREGLVGKLDRACRQQAIADAAAAGWRSEDLLFVNVEPAWLEPGTILECVTKAQRAGIPLVVELTERALTARPREVLQEVRWLREQGVRIALDDVGADHRSLALMPFLSPDIVKLDRAIIQAGTLSSGAARVVNAVAAEAERTGSVILAEGIETEAHLVQARATGARLGQGWLFGRPMPLAGPRPERTASVSVPRHLPVADEDVTPFELIADARSQRRGDKRLLLALSRQLEREAETLGGEALLLATFQHADFFTAATKRWYEHVASRVAFVGALGIGLSSEPAADVRGASLEPSDALAGEWDVIVIAPHFAGAFVAKDLGDQSEDMKRRFDFVVTYDRPLVIAAARALLRRVIRSS